MENDHIFYKALSARDSRFDGVFFVGVTSTGIYCRPICTAKTPKESNCRFFKNAELAEKEFFRPCLRCRPELAPGNAPIDQSQRIASLIVQELEEGGIEDGISLEEIAVHFELSSRQIRRIIQKEFGVSPIKLIQTRRLLLAKQLLQETKLSITDIAFSCGFKSLRRFNDAFSKSYRMSPSHIRKALNKDPKKDFSNSLVLQLSYRPPFDWTHLIQFLKARVIKGVESVSEERYSRTIQLGKHKGWVSLWNKQDKNALMVEISHTLLPVLPVVMGRLRHLFDLNAQPDLIGAHLMHDELFMKIVKDYPGLRVPGAFDGFELAMRAILGQQITVKAATTLAKRVAQAFGERIETPYEDLKYLSPLPQCIASLHVEELTSLGIIASRAKSLITLAEEVVSGRLKLEVGLSPEKIMLQLTHLPGIGKWTAHYIAMRALRWPDAFPKEDIVLRKVLGGLTAVNAEKRSQNWRPWRSYATLYLWLMHKVNEI